MGKSVPLAALSASQGQLWGKGAKVRISKAGVTGRVVPGLVARAGSQREGAEFTHGVHPCSLERAQPGCSASLGGAQPLSASPTAPGWAVPAAALSTAWPFSHPCWSRGSEFPLPGLWGFAGTCSSFPVQNKLLFKLLPPSSGVRGKPSLGAGGCRGRDPLAARVPVPCASRASPDFPGAEQGLDGALGPGWHSPASAQPLLLLSGSLPCWDKVAAAGRVSQGRSEERGLPWQEQQLCSVSLCWERGQPCSRAGNAAEGRWVFPTGHTSIPLEVKRAFPAGNSERLLFPSKAASAAAAATAEATLVPKALVSQCWDRHGQRVHGVF